MKKFIGDKAFYKMVFALLIPMMIQQGLTSFVNLLDNLMVGRIGTAGLSSVAIVNQLIMIFNLVVFGGVSGASIFSAQYYGVGDYEGMRNTFRYKLYIGVISTVICIGIFSLFGTQLIRLYLHGEAQQAQMIEQTMMYAKQYLSIMMVGLFPYMISICYSSSLKDMGCTVLPMASGVTAIVINLCLNYVFIFGKFGAPAMGVAGAALATVIARFCEMLILIIVSHRSKEKYRFLIGAYRSPKIPIPLVKKVFKTGMPLMINETMWAVGQAAIVQSYAFRGITVVAAFNIQQTAFNLFCTIMFAMGNAIAIIVGQQLGSGDIDRAKDTDRKLVFFGVASHVVVGLVLIGVSPLIPMIYNTEDAVRRLAKSFLMLTGAFLPLNAFNHGTYFTLRSGGKTVLTMIFDSGFSWCVCLPLAYCLSHFTGMPILWLFICVNMVDLIKAVIGAFLLRSGIWANNVISGIGKSEA